MISDEEFIKLYVNRLTKTVNAAIAKTNIAEDKECVIDIGTDNGYPAAYFCGGIYEVSIMPKDTSRGFSDGCMYIASVGSELLQFRTLTDAVDSFIECIEEARITRVA
ncbi:hypothetical protein [Pantoea eucrina]|uniref:hypothetical protein n=1 Tax=Pantoea eucrina TaxID=472693 RepID=UPI000A25A14C|nr:hypothetical protein [Pantoea eucrina]ORM76481.1 hypothetical protein HA43_14725 [Pantoea eucrina]